MVQDSGLLFGLLVATPQAEKHVGIPEEEIIMEEQTKSMIEEAAYYLAEKRGFVPGYEMEDWLEAKKQIEDQLLQLYKPRKKRTKLQSKK